MQQEARLRALKLSKLVKIVLFNDFGDFGSISMFLLLLYKVSTFKVLCLKLYLSGEKNSGGV